MTSFKSIYQGFIQLEVTSGKNRETAFMMIMDGTATRHLPKNMLSKSQTCKIEKLHHTCNIKQSVSK